ncbi:MAG: 23S rRNA (uracil(1939)-C(5))-methyltransferase RlmD [Oscillospiraceae bacterium]|nr:23S rRNA (uracil(1939)-C(5))-methyltransferase RlmD [Oscillospiraceae bacterium]
MDQKFRCPVYKKCGGCQLDVTYPQQLSFKQRTVATLLGQYRKAEPIIGMDDPFHYRCKVSTAFGYSHGHAISGVWQSSSGKLTPVENCALEDERAGAIVAAIKELLPGFKLRTYDERSGKGFLRFVMIRIGKQSGEILVALGTGSGIFPEKKNFAAALVKKCPDITTIVQNISTDRLNLLLGREETVLYGKGYITDRLCGYDFRISARSFFQINPVQTEKLYATAVEFADLKGKETVIDAYCGVGTIGIIASAKAKKVIAAEVNIDAVKNARENVRLNGIDNVEVIKADAGEFMAALAEEGEKIDVVFTDPPRAGCSRQFLASLVKLAPAKVVYVSCNPETQARDLQYLTRSGYKVMRIRPVDMFPFTRHVETVVLMILDGV